MYQGHYKCLLSLFKCKKIQSSQVIFLLLIVRNVLFLKFQHDTQINSHHSSYLHSLLQICGSCRGSAILPQCFTWISCPKQMKMDVASFCSCMTS